MYTFVGYLWCNALASLVKAFCNIIMNDEYLSMFVFTAMNKCMFTKPSNPQFFHLFMAQMQLLFTFDFYLRWTWKYCGGRDRRFRGKNLKPKFGNIPLHHATQNLSSSTMRAVGCGMYWRFGCWVLQKFLCNKQIIFKLFSPPHLDWWESIYIW